MKKKKTQINGNRYQVFHFCKNRSIKISFIHIFFSFLFFDLRFPQSQNTIQIKIVEISPKLQFIGANIEETIQLQSEHEQIHRKLQV